MQLLRAMLLCSQLYRHYIAVYIIVLVVPTHTIIYTAICMHYIILWQIFYLQSLRTTRKSHLILLSCELAVISRALSVAAVELSLVASALSVPGPELACADLSVT